MTWLVVINISFQYGSYTWYEFKMIVQNDVLCCWDEVLTVYLYNLHRRQKRARGWVRWLQPLLATSKYLSLISTLDMKMPSGESANQAQGCGVDYRRSVLESCAECPCSCTKRNPNCRAHTRVFWALAVVHLVDCFYLPKQALCSTEESILRCHR